MSAKAEHLCHLFLVSAHSKFLAAFEENEMIAVEPGMYRLNIAQVDDDRAGESAQILSDLACLPESSAFHEYHGGRKRDANGRNCQRIRSSACLAP